MDEITTHYEDALARLRERSKGKPKIAGLISAVCDQIQGLESDALIPLYTDRSIANGSGVVLDMIGVIVGQPRNGLDDTTYKRYLRARVAANRSNGTVDTVVWIMNLLLNDEAITAVVTEFQPAAFEIDFQYDAIEDTLLDILSSFLTDIRPNSVRGIIRASVYDLDETFAFPAFCQLDGAHSSGGFTVTVSGDTSGFPSSGTLIIDEGNWNEEIVEYTAKTATTFTGAAISLLFNHVDESPVTNGDWGLGFNTTNVVWEDLNNTYVDGQRLLKVSDTDAWDSEGHSENSIEADGFGQFRISESGWIVFVGMADAQEIYVNNEYTVRTFPEMTAQVYEVLSGGYQGSPWAIAVGDLIRIAVNGSEVSYWHRPVATGDWVRKHLSAVSRPVNPLILSGYIYDAGGVVEDAVLVGRAAADPQVFLDYVQYSSAVNCTDAGSGTLTKDAGGSAWNAGAISGQEIEENGYIEWVVASIASSVDYYCGLSNGDTDQSRADIDFAIQQDENQTYIRENYALVQGGPNVAVGDRLRVAVFDGKVTYWHKPVGGEWTLIYASIAAPSMPLTLDSSIYAEGTSITNVIIASEHEEHFAEGGHLATARDS